MTRLKQDAAAQKQLSQTVNQGEPLVKGKRVTGFTDREEAAMNLTHVVPFLVEDELKRIGGLYEKAADWAPFALVDGRVVTGQNPASSIGAANAPIIWSQLGRLLSRYPKAGGGAAVGQEAIWGRLLNDAHDRERPDDAPRRAIGASDRGPVS